MRDRRREAPQGVRPALGAWLAVACVAAALASGGCSTTEEPRRAPAPAKTRESAAPRPSRVHVVQRGENLFRISRRYGVPQNAVASANGISDPTKLSVGQRLTIPGVGGGPTAVVPPGSGEWTRSDPRGRSDAPSLVWPVSGRVSSGFGMRRGAHHDGLDIPMTPGTPIRAAEAGRVIHSGGGLSGYGNTIILRHAGRLSTVYAHNRKNLVRVGEFVERGQVIGEVGRSGRASTSHLHFEVRRDGSPIDPIDYLPCSTQIASAC